MKAYGHTLGCKVNAYETEALLGALKEKGHERALSPSEASIILINTCAVTGVAAQKSRQAVAHFRRLRPDAVIVAMGCYAKEDAERLVSSGASIVLGTDERNLLFASLERFEKDGKPFIALSETPRSKQAFEELGSLGEARVRSYLKIQDGCDKFCTYCAIPFLRGKSRSRLPESVLREAKRLLEKGAREIVLSGVESGLYGADLTPKTSLAGLLNDLFMALPELKRLRISSLDASEIDASFLEVYEKCPALLPHFHLSLQSGSPSVLKRMGRHYGPEEYFEAVSALRSVRPETAITTDVIVGFPGETDAEFEETMRFAERVAFAEIHVFPYSRRKGTKAALFPDLPPSVKKARVCALLDLSKRLREAYRSRFYGRPLPILWEEYDEGTGLAKGHSPNYLLVQAPFETSPVGSVTELIYTKDNAAD